MLGGLLSYSQQPSGGGFSNISTNEEDSGLDSGPSSPVSPQEAAKAAGTIYSPLNNSRSFDGIHPLNPNAETKGSCV